jgi:glycine cleavage system H lipoate-binding protein
MESIIQNRRSTDEPQPCIWMQAGIVGKKTCNRNYSCPECTFDRAMKNTAHENKRMVQAGRTRRGKRGSIIFWKDKLKELPTWERPCIHNMKGHIDFRACTNEYGCADCEFDQYFSDQYTVVATVRPVSYLQIKGFKVPQGYYLHRGHSWLKIEEGSETRIGIDDFALRLLGPLDRIESPLIGKEVYQDQADISLYRGENKANVLSPISGIVTSINPGLRETGRIANDDPYTEGWVMTIHPKNLREDLKNLMINRESGRFVGEEVEHLYDLVEETSGPLAADGGYLGHDIYGGMPQIGWKNLTRRFLKN